MNTLRSRCRSNNPRKHGGKYICEGILIALCILLYACKIMPYQEDHSNTLSPMEQTDHPPLGVQLEQFTSQHLPSIKIEHDEKIERGEALFNLLCTECHGYSNETGEKSVFIIDGIKKPPKLNQIGEDTLARPLSPDYLKATIQRGQSKPAQAHSMPSWEQILNDDEINDLVAFIISVRTDNTLGD